MLTVTPKMTTSVQSNDTTFKGGKKSFIKTMKNLIAPKLTSEQKLIEGLNGRLYAKLGHSAEEIKIRLMNEALTGNSEFVKGAKEILSNNAAKNAYKK